MCCFSRPQAFCLNLENVTNNLFLIVTRESDELSGDMKFGASFFRRAYSNDSCRRLNHGEGRKDDLQNQNIIHFKPSRRSEPQPAGADIHIRQARNGHASRMTLRQ